MTENSEIRIYIVHHNDGVNHATDQMYQPVMAGNILLPGEKSIPGDDSGENISAKNRYYSELTVIYWVWKNTFQKVTGFCHYRRFFTALPEPFLYRLKRILYFPAGLYRRRLGLIYTRRVNYFSRRILNREQLEDLLLRYDAVLPPARGMKNSVEAHYSRYHDIKDLKILEAVLTDLYPDYLDAFHRVIKSKRLYANNMFILKDMHFREFMQWWFGVIFEFEKRIDLNHYQGYQKRIIGFIAERLLNVWFEKKQLKCVELPVIYFKKLKVEHFRT